MKITNNNGYIGINTRVSKSAYSELERKYRAMLVLEDEFIKRFPEAKELYDELSELHSDIGELAATIQFLNGYHEGAKFALSMVGEEG